MMPYGVFRANDWKRNYIENLKLCYIHAKRYAWDVESSHMYAKIYIGNENAEKLFYWR